MTIRDRPLPSIVPALYPEKQPEATRSQAVKVEMPARLAALTKQDAIECFGNRDLRQTLQRVLGHSQHLPVEARYIATRT